MSWQAWTVFVTIVLVWVFDSYLRWQYRNDENALLVRWILVLVNVFLFGVFVVLSNK